ncbi:MAG: hypothetical protein VYA77_03145 [Pseudomonadota bacterium]|nr:hypothetical protein [Pseudomonadota bacterium]
MVHKLTSVILIGVLLQACSGNSSSTRTVSGEEETYGISGRIGTATWGTRISATPINYEGGPTLIENDSGNLVYDGAASQSSQTGTYELTAEAEDVSGSFIFIANTDNGDVFYRCERVQGCDSLAYGKYVPLPDDLDVRAGVGELLDGMTVNVNWITDIASSMARTVYIDAVTNGLSADDRADINQAVLDDIETAKTGVYNQYTMELANLHVSELFGLTDIISSPVVAPSQITQVETVSGDALVEGVYYGALIAALPYLADSANTDFVTKLGEITGDVIDRRGQLLEKKSNASDVVTKFKIFSAASTILRDNINYFNGLGARVPAGAVTALERLDGVAASMREDVETSVDVDVPARLAGWRTAIENSKYFLTDLTAAVKNFWGYDENQPSFIDPVHGRRVDSYYLAHETALNTVADLAFGPTGVLNEILEGAEILARCEFGEGDCTPPVGFAIETDESDSAGLPSDRVLIDGSLRLVMRPIETTDADAGLYNVFDFEIESADNPEDDVDAIPSEIKNALALGNGKKLYWYTEAISDGSITTRPYVRVFYEDSYASPPVGSFLDDSDPSHVAPTQIAIVWPLVRFEQGISGAGAGDNGEHEFNALIEANLVGVKDPLDDASQTRYNPVTFVVRARSTLEPDAENRTDLNVQLRTTNSSSYYPTSKWPATHEFFLGRPDAPATIGVEPDDEPLVKSLYRDQTVLSNGRVIEYFDEELRGRDFISRIKLYPYDSTTNTTRSESCNVSIVDGERVEQSCDTVIELAGEVTLDELLERNFENNVLSRYSVPGNGIYEIDLSTSDIVSGNEYQGLTTGTPYGPFSGTFYDDIELGIDRLTAVAESYLKDPEEEALIPVIFELALERQVEDEFALSASYGFGSEETYENISNQLGVVAGGDAQGFYLELAVSEEQISDGEGGLKTIEVERGYWLISRSNVSMGGTDQSVLAQIATRTEYTQGNDETACGFNDRDKLSAAAPTDADSNDGCEAVAYLTVRGALVGTIREERENVFVARFVDGTWMIIGD